MDSEGSMATLGSRIPTPAVAHLPHLTLCMEGLFYILFYTALYIGYCINFLFFCFSFAYLLWQFHKVLSWAIYKVQSGKCWFNLKCLLLHKCEKDKLSTEYRGVNFQHIKRLQKDLTTDRQFYFPSHHCLWRIGSKQAKFKLQYKSYHASFQVKQVILSIKQLYFFKKMF